MNLVLLFHQWCNRNEKKTIIVVFSIVHPFIFINCKSFNLEGEINLNSTDRWNRKRWSSFCIIYTLFSLHGKDSNGFFIIPMSEFDQFKQPIDVLHFNCAPLSRILMYNNLISELFLFTKYRHCLKTTLVHLIQLEQ